MLKVFTKPLLPRFLSPGLPLLILCVYALGCGGGDNDDNSEAENSSRVAAGDQDENNADGHSSVNPANSTEKTKKRAQIHWPVVQPLPPLNIETTPRPQPKSPAAALATIEAIRKTYDVGKIPDILKPPFTRDSVFQFIKTMKFLSEQRATDMAWLKTLDVDSVPDVDQVSRQQIRGKRDSVLSGLEKYVANSLERSLKYSRENLKLNIESGWDMIRRGAEVDMSDQQQVRRQLANELLNRSRDAAIVKATNYIDLAILLDQQFEIESAWPDKRKQLLTWVAQYRQNLVAAASAIRPPEDVGDRELTKIAGEVFARDDLPVPKPVRVIVNSRKASKSLDYYTVDFGERSVTKSPYRWEEFQVATIEQEGERYFLWYTTLLKYSNGPQTVPVGKWVIGPRHKSAPIAAENINPPSESS